MAAPETDAFRPEWGNHAGTTEVVVIVTAGLRLEALWGWRFSRAG
jgi:hypothetical protein